MQVVDGERDHCTQSNLFCNIHSSVGQKVTLDKLARVFIIYPEFKPTYRSMHNTH